MNPISMHDASAPVFAKMLGNMLSWLEAAKAHAEAKKFATDVYLTLRLAPDMLPFTKQIQIASDAAKGCIARLSGQEPPKFEDNEATLDELIERIRKYNKTAEIIECAHGPVHLENVFTREREPLDFLKDKWVGAISAIAVPEAFEGSLKKLGARVEIRRRFADHYRFSRREVDRFMQRCVERDMQLILTTEKDAVRFPRPTSIDVPVYFLRIEVEILKGRGIWDDMIRRLCNPEPAFESVLRHRHAYRI